MLYSFYYVLLVLHKMVIILHTKILENGVSQVSLKKFV